MLLPLFASGAGCETLWQRFGDGNQRTCIVNPADCTPKEVCNPFSESGEPRAGTSCSEQQPLCRMGLICDPAQGLCMSGTPAPLSTAVRPNGQVCWNSPVPLGQHLWSVWGTAPDQVWFVGNAGATVRWDGSSFRQVPSGTTDSLNDV